MAKKLLSNNAIHFWKEVRVLNNVIMVDISTCSVGIYRTDNIRGYSTELEYAFPEGNTSA